MSDVLLNNIVHITEAEISAGIVLHTSQAEKDLWNENAVSGDNLLISRSPQHYTAASDTVSGNLQGIDDKLNEIVTMPLSGDIISVVYAPTSYIPDSETVSGNLQGIDEVLSNLLDAIASCDDCQINYTTSNYTATTNTVSGNFDGISNKLQEIKDIQDAPLDDRSVTYTSTVYSTTDATVSGNLDGIANKLDGLENEIDSLSGLNADSVWTRSTTGSIKPKSDPDEIDLPYMQGREGSITTTNISGTIKDSCSTITDGPRGLGSVLNIGEFINSVPSGELLPGDMWFESTSPTAVVLNYWNGTTKFSAYLVSGDIQLLEWQ
jgi:hypothetical protein